MFTALAIASGLFATIAIGAAWVAYHLARAGLSYANEAERSAQTAIHNANRIDSATLEFWLDVTGEDGTVGNVEETIQPTVSAHDPG
jgi:hypothetical protein